MFWFEKKGFKSCGTSTIVGVKKHLCQKALLVVIKINFSWIWWYHIFLCLDIQNGSLSVADNNHVIIIYCIRSKYFSGAAIAGFHARMTIPLRSQNILALTWLRISWLLIYSDRWCFKRKMLRFYYISYYLSWLICDSSKSLCWFWFLLSCVSSIVKWGYQDNFKPVYLFYENISRAQKSPKSKTSDFQRLRSLCTRKIVALVVQCLLNFVLLVNVCLWVFLCARIFSRKNK